MTPDVAAAIARFHLCYRIVPAFNGGWWERATYPRDGGAHAQDSMEMQELSWIAQIANDELVENRKHWRKQQRERQDERDRRRARRDE